MIQSVRGIILFVFCLTWYTLSRFGGVSMNRHCWLSQSLNKLPETLWANCTASNINGSEDVERKVVFCRHIVGWWESDMHWGWERPGVAFIFLSVWCLGSILFIGR